MLENETLQCEGKLTLKECWDALVSMGSNKSPRNDGLTKKFYVCFFAEVGSLFVSTLNFCHDKGESTSSQKQAVITLIEKWGKDKRFIKNWRPISLLNVDIKIASEALAMSLKKVISKLIAYDQTAYVQGRYIGESIRVIQDLIDFADLEEQEGLIFSSDFEKAFNSVDHNFLFSVLTKFGFGLGFIRCVKTLLCRSESCIMNNGCYFPLHRGTRQRDPLFPYLFILVLEILLKQVISDTDILGFTIEDISLKLSAYANDAYYFLKDIASLQVLFQLFSNFEEFSSLKVNLDKCEACWIGASKFNTDTPLGCSWVSPMTQ